MGDFYYKEFNSGSFAQISRKERNVYNLLLCSRTYFEGPHLDGVIITNIGADGISAYGGVVVLSTHNRLQIIIFSEPLYLIWFGIPRKNIFPDIFFCFGKTVNTTQLLCRIFLQSILLRRRSEEAKQS